MDNKTKFFFERRGFPNFNTMKIFLNFQVNEKRQIVLHNIDFDAFSNALLQACQQNVEARITQDNDCIVFARLRFSDFLVQLLLIFRKCYCNSGAWRVFKRISRIHT